MYFHPDAFLEKLAGWQHFFETLRSPVTVDTLSVPTASGPEQAEIPAVFQDYLRELDEHRA